MGMDVVYEVLNGRRNRMVGKKGREKRKPAEPVTAPGYDDRKFGEDASAEEIKKGNYTKTIRVYYDENDPS